MLGTFFSKHWKPPACDRKRSAYNARFMHYPPEIKRALRTIIISQCVGLIGPLLFSNGFMLAYLLRLGVPAYRVLFLFALMPLINMALTMPLAWAADCIGKKKLGGTGLLISVFGFFMIPLAAFMPNSASLWLTAGILIFSAGNTAIGASWFALLSPIVPEEIRGRWFGQMRTAWQTVAIVFALGLTALLRHRPELYIFQIVLVVTGLMMIARWVLYMQIPELEPVCPSQDGFRHALRTIFHIPGYMRFCVYIFLLAFISAAGGLFGLLEKDVLHFSDSLLVMMGNLMAIGTVGGFLTGGKMVDRFGAKPVFLGGQVLIVITLAGLLLRNHLGFDPITLMGAVSLLWGATQGATGIAGTSELLALIPPENKSLSTGFNLTLNAAGLSLAGLLNGQLLKMKLVPSTWTAAGQTLTTYDVLIAGFTVITLLLVIALGLVPTIRQLHSQWLPQNQ